MKKMSRKDMELWEQVKSTVKPLKGDSDHIPYNVLPPKPKTTLIKKENDDITKNKNFVPEIDLHGYTQDEAYEILTSKLSSFKNLGIKKVIVITGKGKNEIGTLKRCVPLWFESNSYLSSIVRNFNLSPKNTGSYEVYL